MPELLRPGAPEGRGPPDASHPSESPSPWTVNNPGAEGLRVTLAWGPVSCQVPAPGLPCAPAGGLRSELEAADPSRELRGEEDGAGGGGTQLGLCDPRGRSLLWAHPGGREEGRVSKHQLAQPPGTVLPGTKAPRAFIKGNYPPLPAAPCPAVSPAKWALWQLEGLAGRMSRRKNRWLAWAVGRGLPPPPGLTVPSSGVAGVGQRSEGPPLSPPHWVRGQGDALQAQTRLRVQGCGGVCWPANSRRRPGPQGSAGPTRGTGRAQREQGGPTLLGAVTVCCRR